jgi:hypothetical protein
MKLIKLSDNINGRIRFNVLGVKGFYAKRKYKSRGWGIERQRTFTQIHLGKRSIAIETRGRRTSNFAG